MKTKKKLGRLKMPVNAWGVFDPKGILRCVYTEKPEDSVIAWVSTADEKNRYSSGIELPKDLDIAHRRGYRLRKCKVVKE